MTDPIEIARRSYQAYADGDRAALEPLIAEDFRFTSPLDNRLDRATYFARCWPNNEAIASFDFIYLAAQGEQVFVVYEAQTKAGKRFRNSEVLTVRDGQIVAAEVYFGWNLPHEAPDGGFLES